MAATEAEALRQDIGHFLPLEAEGPQVKTSQTVSHRPPCVEIQVEMTGSKPSGANTLDVFTLPVFAGSAEGKSPQITDVWVTYEHKHYSLRDPRSREVLLQRIEERLIKSLGEVPPTPTCYQG